MTCKEIFRRKAGGVSIIVIDVCARLFYFNQDGNFPHSIFVQRHILFFMKVHREKLF